MSAHSDTSYHFTDLLEAARIQFRVISALVMRELRIRFGHHRIGYLWALLDPCAHIATWFLIFATMRQASPVHDMSALLFIATGIVPLFFFRKIAAFLKGAIRSGRALGDEPKIKNVDFWIARFLLEAWAMSIVAFLVFGTLIGIGAASLPRDIGGCVGVLALLLFLGFGFGAFNSIMVILSSTYDMLLGIFGRVIYMTSGIFFSADRIPPEMLPWISINPVFHGLELFRSSYSHTYQSTAASPVYLACWGLGLLLAAMVLERVTRGKLQSKSARQEFEEVDEV